MIPLTKAQARRFLLLKQGLLGARRFEGKQGVLDYIAQAGCILFDPVDICGKSPEIALQARVKGFRKSMLYTLLYRDRALVDHFDKMMAIFPTADWPYFHGVRAQYQSRIRSHQAVETVAQEILDAVGRMGYACSRDLNYPQKVDWYWSNTNLARATLEALYFRGDLVIHHKEGTVKYYARAQDCLPLELLSGQDPFPSPLDGLCWRVARRVGGVGLLWNRASDAWLDVRKLSAKDRNAAFYRLTTEGHLLPVAVEGLSEPLYCLRSDRALLESACSNIRFRARTELLAPLDNLLWDRKLIQALFDFSYKWEVYTPAKDRQYGHYVLPILQGERFIGRAEPVCDRKAGILRIQGLWLEPEVKMTKALKGQLLRCFTRFAKLNGCQAVEWERP